MIHIIFASQTGTSQDVALQMAYLFKNQGWSSKIRSTEKLTIQQLKQMDYAFFLISTTGDGQPTDSCTRIWSQLLQKSLTQDLLKMKYSVFGFGDSKYGENFNVMARKIDKRLSMLGAQIIAERGLGDQQDLMGYRNEFNVWIKGVVDSLNEVLKKNQNPQYTIQDSSLQTRQLLVQNIQYLQQQSERTTYYVSFKTQLSNQPGDILTIFPKNNEQHVQEILKYFNLNGSQILQKQGIKESSSIMFRQIINISDTAPFLLFKQLHSFIEDQLLKTKLLEIKNNYQQYFQYVKKFRRSIVQILQDFPVKITLKYFLEVINFIKPRKYSIATSKKGYIGLLVRLVQYNITPHRKLFGMVSQGLLNEGIGSRWRGYVTQGKFRFNKNNDYFMVGVGTGIAPFISFLDHEQKQEVRIYLNFGNRNQKEFYMRQYITQKLKAGNLIVSTAFSRADKNKMHVQQLFGANKEQIVDFFNKEKTRIYICGPYSNFAESIVNSLKKVLNLSEETIKQMKRNGQIVSQCW